MQFYHKKGFVLKANEGCIYYFNVKRLKWIELTVKEKDVNLEYRRKYFNKKKFDDENHGTDECHSRIVQINKDIIYVIGGVRNGRALLGWDYTV